MIRDVREHQAINKTGSRSTDPQPRPLKQRARAVVDRLMRAGLESATFVCAWDDGDAQAVQPYVDRACGNDDTLWAAVMVELWGGTMNEYLAER